MNANAEYIKANSKHRILIPLGKIGLAWEGNKSILLDSHEPYCIDSRTFQCVLL